MSVVDRMADVSHNRRRERVCQAVREVLTEHAQMTGRPFITVVGELDADEITQAAEQIATILDRDMRD